MSDTQETRKGLDINEVYKEIGTNYRHFLTWRHRLLAGYVAILAGFAVAFGWISEHDPRLAQYLPPALLGITLVFYLMEVRNRDLYHACTRCGAALESEAPLPMGAGIFSALDRCAPEWPFAHSWGFDTLFLLVTVGSAVFYLVSFQIYVYGILAGACAIAVLFIAVVALAKSSRAKRDARAALRRIEELQRLPIVGWVGV